VCSQTAFRKWWGGYYEGRKEDFGYGWMRVGKGTKEMRRIRKGKRGHKQKEKIEGAIEENGNG
jgi:hypothetical protein